MIIISYVIYGQYKIGNKKYCTPIKCQSSVSGFLCNWSTEPVLHPITFYFGSMHLSELEEGIQLRYGSQFEFFPAAARWIFSEYLFCQGFTITTVTCSEPIQCDPCFPFQVGLTFGSCIKFLLSTFWVFHTSLQAFTR